MALLSIRTYGHPVLRQVAKEVPYLDDVVRRLVENMFETMYVSDGIGLAAPQVGESQRVIVLDVSPVDNEARPMAIINPVITGRWGKDVQEEGCLSLPGIREDISRPTGVEVTGLDVDGKQVRIRAEGMLARALQHEIDHLNGLLIIDRISNIRRQLLKSTLDKISREGA